MGTTARRRVLDRSAADNQARPVELTSIVNFLLEGLGRQLLALTLDVSVRTLDRWAAGENAPQLEHEMRLRHAYQVFQLVQTVEAPATVRAWFMGMNPQLDDASPAEAISEDRSRDVLAAARAFVNGG